MKLLVCYYNIMFIVYLTVCTCVCVSFYYYVGSGVRALAMFHNSTYSILATILYVCKGSVSNYSYVCLFARLKEGPDN